ncbi:MAG: Asp-tRNA(Asn)/Glu-tRNA(Gln) amidotransferase subunit GatA, partial [Balneolales bacterium]|nr:Asp-tRNA(Asn)/Glu-tRNA(Gln) amidotransferase subunit GatA [Balneolales bacterium]
MSPHTIAEARKKVLDGEITLPELVEAYFATIEKSNPEINAFVYLNKSDALAQAEKIQQKVKDGTEGTLMGAIMGIKDVICEKDKPTTCASDVLGDFHSVYDATVIERLKAEDAILIGRLNMDEFA